MKCSPAVPAWDPCLDMYDTDSLNETGKNKNKICMSSWNSARRTPWYKTHFSLLSVLSPAYGLATWKGTTTSKRVPSGMPMMAVVSGHFGNPSPCGMCSTLHRTLCAVLQVVL